jgi:hypothetical protein
VKRRIGKVNQMTVGLSPRKSDDPEYGLRVGCNGKIRKSENDKKEVVFYRYHFSIGRCGVLKSIARLPKNCILRLIILN